MSDVPKIVRQRLARPPAPGEHPEANLLAAFAEGGLTQREREQVLVHLGTCSACRDTVALAAPDSAVEMPTIAVRETRWVRWPVLRWAGLAAAVVVVAAAVVMQNSRRVAEAPRPQAATPATSGTTPVPAEADQVATRLDDHSAAKAAAPRRDLDAKKELSASKKKDAFLLGKAEPAPSATTAEAVAPNVSQQMQARNEAGDKIAIQQIRPQASPGAGAVAGGLIAAEPKQQQQQAVQVPAAVESVEVSGGLRDAEVQKPKLQDQARAEFDRPSDERAANQLRGRATTPGASGGPAPASAVAAPGAPLMKTAMMVAPRWRLNAGGALERSADAGSTWQGVEVAAPAPRLRTFCALGPEVWAGGSGGALYHSADGGRTWARVAVKEGDATLDSDIVRVEFTDAKHGWLKAASGATWTTGDAGATWSLRR